MPLPKPAKNALITGAGSGIGRACARALQAAGWHVALAGRRREPLEETAANPAPSGGHFLIHPADVTDPASVAALFAAVHETFGRLDLLFNNAGIFSPSIPFEDLSLDQWLTAIDANLTSAFLCSQHAVRLMKAQSPRGGRILNNGSISAQVPRPHSAPYTATKHAITGLTKSLALDGRAFDIACSQIDIGNAATDMTGAFATGVLQADGSRKPEARFDLDHVASVVLAIASLPSSVNVPAMTLMATGMPFIGRG